MPADQTEWNLKNLHAASMTLIETTGVRLHHADMLEIVRANGIRVADDRVYFTRDQLMAWGLTRPCRVCSVCPAIPPIICI